MLQEFRFGGFGGQGVLSLGELLANAALNEGKNVSWYPSYGPEMRGGTANCTVVVSDEMIGSPVASTIHTLVAMNGPALAKFEGIVRPGGYVFYNSSLIPNPPAREDINVVAIPAGEIALELGDARVANMVMLGAILGRTGIIAEESAAAAIQARFGVRRPKLVPMNLEAIKRGAEVAKA